MRAVLRNRAARVLIGAALTGALVWAGVALADSGPPAPVITVKPANPTNSQSAAFTYTDSQSVSFQCSLDGGSFVACGGPGTSGSKSYAGPLAAGSHQFQVKAVSGSKSTTTSYSWVIDLTAPTVSSITRVGASPTSTTGQVQWTVTFSESVTGVDQTDFALANGGLTGPGLAGVSGSGATYSVTANTGTGSGTLGLNLVDNDSIADAATNKLGGSGAGNGNFTGQAYTFDRTAPSVVSISRAGSSPTNASSVQWTVTFSESVTGVDTGDFALANSGLTSPSLTGVSGSGTSYTITAGSGSGSGALGLNLVDNDSIADSVGNKLGGAGNGNGNFAGQVYAVDRTAPVVASISRVGASPTNASSVQWSVVFSESVAGVDAGDFSLVKTGLGGTPAVTGVSGSGATYTVTASTGSGNGTLGLNLADNDSIADSVGNKLGGTGNGNGNFTGAVYTLDRTAPTVVSLNRSDPSPTNAASVHWTATFSEPVSGVAASGSNFSLVAVGLTGSPVVTGAAGSGTTYSVTATTGSGTSGSTNTLQLRATSAGAIVDAAGNALTGLAVNGQTYTIDKTAPNAPTIQFAPFAWPPVGWSSTNATFAFDDSSPDVASYLCKLDAGAFTGCISPQSYPGLAQGEHVFKVKAVDQAGNVSTETTWTFFVDTINPTKPVFSQTPPDPSSSAQATFAWSSSDPGYPTTGTGVAGHLCSKENGSWFVCSSPYTYTVQATNNGEHQFSVVAVDWAGNLSDVATYKWKVVVASGVPFTIAGNANGLLYPGAPFTPIALTITNPNTVPIYVTSLTVTVTNDPNGCTNASNVQVQQSPAAPTSNEMAVPASVTNWPVPAAFQPKIRLQDTGVNQDQCKNQTFSLSYSGSAHS